MDALTAKLVPATLVLGRVSGLVATLPVFGSRAVPVRVKAGLALVLTVVLASVTPADPALGRAPWPVAGLLVVREVATGVALGLAVAVVFAAVRQAGMIIKRQMGLAVAQEIDPLSGETSQPVGMLMEMCFTVFFLAAGGHRLLLALMKRSLEVFPLGRGPDPAAMAQALLDAGGAMLVFGLRLAAPMVAAFLVLAVALALLARILPEMNILFASLPLRVGLGLFMAAAILPAVHGFTAEVGDWISALLGP